MSKSKHIATATLMLAFVFIANVQAQSQPELNGTQSNHPNLKNISNKPKVHHGRRSNKRYANQEVGYLKATGNEVAIESFQNPTANNNRHSRRQARNQDIEVENDETHRTKPRRNNHPLAARTETVDNNETITITQRKAQNSTNPGDTATHERQLPRRTKINNPKAQTNTQNLLPYMEQSNLRRSNATGTGQRRRARINKPSN